MSKTGTDLVKHLGELAFATRIKRLGESLQQDVSGLYAELGVDFEPKWFTMLYALYHNSSMSIIELSELLKLTHPAIIQFAAQMEEKKLVQTVKDKNDARRKLLHLTAKGKSTFEKIQPVLEGIETCTRELLHQSGVDMLGAIERTEKLLEEKNMYHRVKDRLNKKFRNEIEIIEYRPEWKEAFKLLNYEWLEKYFKVEPIDEKVLANPRKEILDKGGQIFFALLYDVPVGTCAVKKTDDKTYELLKMAVTEKFQSRGVGRMLAERTIEFVKEQNGELLELDTSRKLDKAIKLYREMGFVETADEPSKEYSRSTIKMRRLLKSKGKSAQAGVRRYQLI